MLSQDYREASRLIMVLLLLDDDEQARHPGRGGAVSSDGRGEQDIRQRVDYLETFRTSPSADALAVFRFTYNEIRDMALELGSFLHRPRPRAASSPAAPRAEEDRVYRRPVTDDGNRVALVLQHAANSHVNLHGMAHQVGICPAAMSNLIRVDVSNLIDGLRDELDALVHVDVRIDLI
jgi:hypothetical protein